MNERFRFDAEDPFGSRPDEKPPAGWDEEFWDQVREKIETKKSDPSALRLPSPSRKRGRMLRAALTVGLLAAGTVMLVTSRGEDPTPGDTQAPPPTIVQVLGSPDPPVAVEWASTGGRESGYVVLQSLEPDISYVLIDQRLIRQ